MGAIAFCMADRNAGSVVWSEALEKMRSKLGGLCGVCCEIRLSARPDCVAKVEVVLGVCAGTVLRMSPETANNINDVTSVNHLNR
jgi:hypothetical protein